MRPGLLWKLKPTERKALCANAAGTLGSSTLLAEPKRRKRRSEESRSRKGISCYAREIVTLECTEARKLDAPSRYQTSRNKKTQTERSN